MKTKLFKYLPLVLGFVMALSSCSEDDSDDPIPQTTTPKPIVNITVNGVDNEDSYTVGQNQGVSITINALSASGGGANLDKIRVVQNGDNQVATSGDFDFVSAENNTFDFATNTDKDIKNAENENLVLTGTFSNITSNVGTTTYTITVTDDDGITSTREFEIVVFTSFTTTETGMIYHIGGSKDGSYSLTSDTTISVGDASLLADLSNTDAAGSAFTGSFKVGDTRSLAVDLVRVPSGGYDYATGSMQEAQDVYDAGTPVTSISNPAVDDLYIYSLPNGEIAVVKITSVEPMNNDCNCNNMGRMEFEYKK